LSESEELNQMCGDHPMPSHRHCKYSIREANLADFWLLGELTPPILAVQQPPLEV
jgi:hypothetical protein